MVRKMPAMVTPVETDSVGGHGQDAEQTEKETKRREEETVKCQSKSNRVTGKLQPQFRFDTTASRPRPENGYNSGFSSSQSQQLTVLDRVHHGRWGGDTQQLR